jgi:hypothetical protein
MSTPSIPRWLRCRRPVSPDRPGGPRARWPAACGGARRTGRCCGSAARELDPLVKPPTGPIPSFGPDPGRTSRTHVDGRPGRWRPLLRGQGRAHSRGSRRRGRSGPAGTRDGLRRGPVAHLGRRPVRLRPRPRRVARRVGAERCSSGARTGPRAGRAGRPRTCRPMAVGFRRRPRPPARTPRRRR